MQKDPLIAERERYNACRRISASPLHPQLGPDLAAQLNSELILQDQRRGRSEYQNIDPGRRGDTLTLITVWRATATGSVSTLALFVEDVCEKRVCMQAESRL